MDTTERFPPRTYPHFGEVPAVVAGSPELRLELDDASASLTGFVCSPSGLTATLRTAARVPEGGGITYAVANRGPTEGAVDIVAIPTDSARESNDGINARLQRGGGGTDGTVHAAVFDLWFPVNVADLQGDLTVEMVWPTHGEAARMTLTGSSLREAADRASTRFAVPLE